MSKTLYLLGYELGEREPVSDVARLGYGFPTDPNEINELAVRIMQDDDAYSAQKGSDLALASIDILTESRKPQLFAPDTPRPIYFDLGRSVMWKFFAERLMLAANARILPCVQLNPNLEEAARVHSSQVIASARAQDGSLLAMTAFNRHDLQSVPVVRDVVPQETDLAIVFESYRQ